MNLIELLNKRKNNEELTEEELAVLKDYDDSLKVHMSELERLKAEKEAVEAKFSNVNTELQDKMRILTEKEEEAKRLAMEKEEIETIYKNSKSAEEARITIEKAKVEKEKAEAIKKAEETRLEREKAEREEKDKVARELKELKDRLALADFKGTVIAEKAKRPYLETGLNNILINLPTKTLEQSQMALEVLLGLYNHEVEMEKWKASQKAGTSIFDVPETKIIETPVEKKNTEDEILAFAKKAGFKVPRKK